MPIEHRLVHKDVEQRVIAVLVDQRAGLERLVECFFPSWNMIWPVSLNCLQGSGTSRVPHTDCAVLEHDIGKGTIIIELSHLVLASRFPLLIEVPSAGEFMAMKVSHE